MTGKVSLLKDMMMTSYAVPGRVEYMNVYADSSLIGFGPDNALKILSAKVDLPWSIWAMMLKFRISDLSITFNFKLYALHR